MSPQADDPSLTRREVLSLDGPRREARQDEMAREAPCEIRLEGRSHVLLMATPAGLEALALGFLLSEGVVSRPEQVLELSTGRGELPGMGPVHWVDARLEPGLARQARARRVAPAATSCGLCGLESFRDLSGGIAPVASGFTVELAIIQKQFEAMEAEQELFRRSGATHAVALGTAEGQLICVGEDVGRHNALDKAIGMAIKQSRDLGQCVCTVSGRLSMEMVLKAARAGLPVVASVSAATALGQSLGQELGLTLLGFVRGERATLYSHAERVLQEGRPLAGPVPAGL
ncbi:MAG: formate dehydrogenase accessory sulfurtransferase FdhD [Desulfarculaceae bacterium]|nr:formate dehydrogenase accessory sulfurtransferase FdhD [Desulfarculaceae bacterium]